MASKSEEDWYKVALGRNTDGLGTLDKAIRLNRNSLRDLGEKVLGNANVVSKLTDVITRAENIQLKALALGTNYSKFVQSNTKALKDSKSNTQALTEALMTGFDQGLRNNTDELNTLIDTMVFQGQKSTVLTGAMANIATVTGESGDIQSKLIKGLEDTNETYGVSTERLARGMASLEGQLQSFSLFGKEAVGALAGFKTALLGRTGGKGESQIDTLLASLDPSNIKQQMLLGSKPLADAIAAGNTDVGELLQRLLESGRTISSRLPSDPVARAMVADNFGRSQITATENLIDLINTGNKLTDEQKKNSSDWQNTLKFSQEKVNNFYNQLAPEMHAVVTKYLPLMIAAKAGTSLIGAGSGMMMGMAARSAARTAATAGAGTVAAGVGGRMVAGRLASLIPGIGILVGLGITFWPQISGYLEDLTKGSEAEKEAVEVMKKAKKENFSFADTGLKMATNIARAATIGATDPATASEIHKTLLRIEKGLRPVRPLPEKVE